MDVTRYSVLSGSGILG